MKRQRLLLIIIAVLAAALAAVYFAVIAPLASKTDNTDGDTPETEEGESLGVGNRFFMFGSMSAEDVASIEVSNDSGGFVFERNKDGDFIIKGYDTVPFNKEKLAKLTNVTAYTLSKVKVASGVSDEKLEEYGLTEPQASWVVTTKGGEKHTVYVGGRLLTGGGYYCMYAGRRTVYVLSQDIAETVLVPIESYVTPLLCGGISKDDFYTVNNFTVYKNGEKLLRIRLVDKEAQRNPDALAECIMDYPTSYYPNTTVYYDFINTCMSFTADSCYKLDASAEDMAETGLDNPAHAITFEYGGRKYEMYFSSLQEDGFYYARSSLYPNVIAVCKAERLELLEYGLLDWTDKYIFQHYITNITEISVETPKYQAAFKLTHGKDEQERDTLAVTANGKALPASAIVSFREYYKSLLAIAVQDYYENDEYCTKTPEEMKELLSDETKAQLVFKYKTLDGKETVIAAYSYSTRHSAVTVNGFGEFYVLTDLITKIENDTGKILRGEQVTAFTKN